MSMVFPVRWPRLFKILFVEPSKNSLFHAIEVQSVNRLDWLFYSTTDEECPENLCPVTLRAWRIFSLSVYGIVP